MNDILNDFLQRLASRKFLATLATAVPLFVTGQTKEGVVVVVAYLLGQSAIDAVKNL